MIQHFLIHLSPIIHIHKFVFYQAPLQLANLTQLQLVGVGVDFVFPWKEKQEEEGITPT